MLSKNQFLFGIVLASLFGGLVALAGFRLFAEKKTYESIEQKQNIRLSNYTDTSYNVPEGLNFVDAASQVRPAVVHIKTLYEASASNSDESMEDMFRDFHGMPDGRFKNQGPRESAGSGVIISADGYIVTNNHVIENAEKIEVVLNDKRSYTGTVIGADPTTDLALVKIEQDNLPFVKYGNSDRLRIGEWVLAVGNPFELTSTVTAGIVSAKARNINILKDKDNMQVESFIQTDAAVNPGNSGGALVNLKGELVGINTAIATSTGFYAGFSFAVPVTLVKKVMDDFLRFGVVQRALLGVSIRDVDAVLAKEKDLKNVRGIYVDNVNENSSAKQAGMKTGDVIMAINGIPVNTTSELQGIVATQRPGDKIEITYERDGKSYATSTILKNKGGDISLTKREETKTAGIMGAEFAAITDKEKQKLGIESGVKIVRLGIGKFKDARLKEGFIITYLDHKAVRTPGELVKMLKNTKSAFLIEGVYENGTKAYQAIAP